LARKLLSARLLFAQNMRRCRSAQGLSQEQLAELAGLHRTYVGSVERGERNVSIDNIEAIAHALAVSVRDLFTDPEQQQGKSQAR
jgi:transcriptional regulator with XRE-family HTH domain